jgi:hypothetical protein
METMAKYKGNPNQQQCSQSQQAVQLSLPVAL